MIYYIFQQVSRINEGFVVRDAAQSWHIAARAGQPETNLGSISDAISSFGAVFLEGWRKTSKEKETARR